ncbi:MAG TPA: YbaK/EbsC family protein [Chloroflexia bacterium]|nr:YbaK/EbsC family protein [Chloroflexia bacterium]
MSGPEYEEKLKAYIRENQIAAEHLSFDQSCHSVAEAAEAVKANPEDFVKNICMLDEQGRLIVAIVKGEDRASTSRVARAINAAEARLATPEEILAHTGFAFGGTPSFGFQATFLVDERVAEKEIIYTGGGSQNSLVKITPGELLRANQGCLTRIRR